LCFGRHQFNCDSLEIVMIVSLTRSDLRDESIMADEAFALSPISARAAQPREEDYDAISEAFMETSRGRWFLGEYAKRNRNADTRMVLDAVARVEENLAAHKQPALESGLAEALAAIRSAVDGARATATAALDSLTLEEKLAPVRKGARVIREIAWRLREIGADGRICDLIDSQLSAIETGCGQISSAGAQTALSAAFDLIDGRLAEFDESDAAPRKAHREKARQEQAHQEAVSAASDEPSAAIIEQAESATDAETAMSAEASPADAVVAAAEAAEAIADAPDVSAEAAAATTEVADMTAEAADAHDDAVLEMIALEMAAPDPSDTDVGTGSDADIAIETGCGQTSSAGAQTPLSAAFDLIDGRVAAYNESDAAPRKADQEKAHQEAVSPSSPAASDEPTAAIIEQAQTATDAETAMRTEASPADAVVAAAKAPEAIAEVPGVSVGAAEATTEVADMTAEAAHAHDDAVLEIALETATPDPSNRDSGTGSNADIDTGSDAMRTAEWPPAEPAMIAEMPLAPPMQAMAPTIQPPAPPSLELFLEPSLEPSLGATLVASGIVRSPKPSASDPLAPIRRMSQAEKIAFFS
jgi:hypothetical protein